jgi:sialidase-1
MLPTLSRRQFLAGVPLVATAIGAARLAAARPSVLPLASLPFASGAMGYTCYRTPAIALTSAGVLLAFCGGRLDNCSDDGDHDVVLRRSLDGGATWGPLQVIANDGRNRCNIPVPVVLSNGRVLLLWVWSAYVRRKEDRGVRRVMVCHSDDQGKTWSVSRDITEQVRLPGWRPWYGLGPGHGFVKQLAPAAGRIVVPARHAERKLGSRSHLIISDDGGSTWQVGAEAMGPTNSSECTACELGDGSVMINSRTSIGFRLVTISANGGTTASSSVVDRNLIEPSNGCQGSLLTYNLNTPTGLATLLFSNPVHPEFRTNGRIRLSRDNGSSWSRGYAYQRGQNAFTGYSDMTRFDSGDIGLIFESGANFRKGQFAEDELDPPGNAASSPSKLPRERRDGRKDNRHDGIAFSRIPFNEIVKGTSDG